MRIQQRLSYFLLGHRWLSLCMTFLITFIPVVGVVGILYAAFVTLRKGAVEGAWFTIAATLPYVISFYAFAPDAPMPFIAWLVLGIALMSNFFTWVFAVMLNRHSTWSQIIQVAALIGVLAISVVHLAYPNVADFWGVELTQLAAKMKSAGTISTDMQAAAINESKEIATGFVTAMLLLSAFSQLVVARLWQANIYHHGLLRRELHNIRLSPLAGFLFLASLLICLYGNSAVLDMMPVLYLLFTVAGLSLIHYLFGLMKSPTRVFWILLMYVSLIYIISVNPESIFLLVSFALADIWLDVRKRLHRA